MIEVENLVKRYGAKTAIDKINFNVEKGEIVGLLGSNGAGKSTTMNIITGYISPTLGTVRVNGIDILKNPVKAKSQIGYLPEHPPLYLDMTVKGYLGFVYNLKKVKLNKSEHIKEICEKVEILDVFNRQIKKLSKGYKQRVGIAQALIGYPPVIILDEPTVGLDPKQIISIRNLIKDLAKNHTMIFSSHILSEVQAICDRVVVIDSGKIISDRSTGDMITGSERNKAIVAHIEGKVDKVLHVLGFIEAVRNIEKTKEVDKETFEYVIEYEGNQDIRKDIFQKLAGAGLALTKLDILDTNLEEVFLNLINNKKKSDETSDEGMEEIEEIEEEIAEDLFYEDEEEYMLELDSDFEDSFYFESDDDNCEYSEKSSDSE